MSHNLYICSCRTFWCRVVCFGAQNVSVLCPPQELVFAERPIERMVHSRVQVFSWSQARRLLRSWVAGTFSICAFVRDGSPVKSMSRNFRAFGGQSSALPAVERP